MTLNPPIHLTLTSSLIILFTFHLIFLSIIPTKSDGVTPVTDPPPVLFQFTPEEKADFKNKATCFQKRARSKEKNTKMEGFCGTDILENFCDSVTCHPITSCPAGQTLTQNVLGHECCPACVEFLPDGAMCPYGSLLKQCANGLFCDPSKGVCAVPPTQRACLADYHNRMLLKSKAEAGSGFWVPAENGPLFLKIEFASGEMELPACAKNGDYQTKQRFKNKAYCVSPDNGSPTFGVADFDKAAAATCKCSTAMFDNLNRIDPNQSDENRDKALDQLDRNLTNHFADTHIKCTPTGDFHQMQCINETCLCVNEFTGIPLTTVDDWDELKDRQEATNEDNKPGTYYISPSGKVEKDPTHLVDQRKMTEEEIKKYEEEEDKRKEEEKKKRGPRIPTKEVNSSATTIFGAFRPLVCFDFKRAKEVNSNFSKAVYTEDCQDQIHTSMNMQKHFTAKGSTVRGLESKSCGYDDRFGRKQCLPDQCRCSNPLGSSIGAYGVELSKAQQMDCRCALEEYFVTNEKQAFDRLKCDGMGNFDPLQCIGDRMCYCSDINGSPISQEFSFKKVNDFILKHAPGYSMGLICSAMRGSVNNEVIWSERDEICYDAEMKWYKTTSCSRPSDTNIVDAYIGAGKSV